MDLLTQLINIKPDDLQEFSLQGLTTKGKVVDMYDGDTCKIILIYNNELLKFTCRLKHLDILKYEVYEYFTPEIKPPKNKPNREIEIANAMKCRNRLMQLSTSCEINLEDSKTKILNPMYTRI